MGSVMGQFPLRNGILLVVTMYKVKSIGEWGKILVMAMGFVDNLGQDRKHHSIFYRKKGRDSSGAATVALRSCPCLMFFA